MNINWRRVAIVGVAAAVLALSPLLLLFGRLGFDSVRERLHRMPFNSAAWQDSKQVESDNPVRIRMVDDLIHSRRLEHRNRAEVERLLGKPTPTNYFKEYDLVYWLGPERGFISIDSEWLVISFDEHGVIQKYSIMRD